MWAMLFKFTIVSAQQCTCVNICFSKCIHGCGIGSLLTLVLSINHEHLIVQTPYKLHGVSQNFETSRKQENKFNQKIQQQQKHHFARGAPPPPPKKKKGQKEKHIYIHTCIRCSLQTLLVGFLFLHFFLSMGAQKPRSDHFLKFIYFEIQAYLFLSILLRSVKLIWFSICLQHYSIQTFHWGGVSMPPLRILFCATPFSHKV